MGNSTTRLGSRLSTVSSSLLESLPNSSFHVVMLGLDSAGKTTVLYRLKLDHYVNTVPTIGFNCEKIKGTTGGTRGVSFVVWDVGGQDKLRPLWRSYTRCTDAIVYVVDSVDSDRLEEARTELFKTLKTPENSGVPLLLLANKQDLPGALEIDELEARLSLKELTPLGHLWDIATSCAITGDGLEESLEKLHDLIVGRRKMEKERVTVTPARPLIPSTKQQQRQQQQQQQQQQQSQQHQQQKTHPQQTNFGKDRKSFGSTTSSDSYASTSSSNFSQNK